MLIGTVKTGQTPSGPKRMKKPTASAKTVLESILDWSEDRPAWQRDALRRIVAKGRLDHTEISELVDLCKQGSGAKGIVLKPGPLAKGHLPANPGQGAAVSLESITAVAGVNNLAPGQTFAFGTEGITIVYGDNGAGKSGYARILKRACRARHAGKIEPNIYAQQPPPPALRPRSPTASAACHSRPKSGRIRTGHIRRSRP